jgi:hypothetical protein
MKRKRFFTIAIALSTLVAVLAFPLTGCTGEVGFTTASLSKATMCKSVDSETREPVEPTNVFSPDTPEIFCSVNLSNAPSDTEVSSEWIYVKGELEDVSDYLIDEVSITTDGTRYVSFSVTRPDNGWPTGDYKVVLYLDGNEKTSVTFKVQ